jgi:hypothetical protein
MIIRQARLGDLNKIIPAYLRLVKYRSIFERKNDKREIKEFVKRFEEDINKDEYVCYIALEKELVIGMIEGYTYDLYNINKKAGYIESLFVYQRFRKHHVEKKLFLKTMNWLHQHNKNNVVLDFHHKDSDTMHLMEHMGFALDITHHNYLRMYKKL